MMNDGVLLVNKPLNMTSRDVVNEVCKILKTRKIGHTGTLDPNASGVLVLCVGNATKIVQFLTSENKEYVATITLGIKTDTLDACGEILERKEVKNISESQVVEVLNSFLGKQKQIPPMYSAVRVNGKRLHELARQGIEVEREERDIEVFSLDLISGLEFKDGLCEFKIKTSVSKGTFIRVLSEDIGKKLGYPAIMSTLVRTKQGHFDLDNCSTLDEIRNSEYNMISIDDALRNLNGYEIKDANIVKKIMNGAIIDRVSDKNEMVVLYYNSKALAVYKIYNKDNSKMKPVRVFKGESN